MAENNAYEGLMNWPKQGWYGLPKPEIAMPLIKATCTQEEAELLTGFPYKGTYLDDLAALKQMPVEELGRRLDAESGRQTRGQGSGDGGPQG